MAPWGRAQQRDTLLGPLCPTKRGQQSLPLLLLLLSMKPAILFVSETKDQLDFNIFNKH